MYICVDFDGTIVDHMFPELGAPVPGAIEWMKKWQEAGAKLILWTVRNDRADRYYLDEAVGYCEDNEIKLFGANENPDQKSWSGSPKAYAVTYVDDAAFGCPLIKVEGFNRLCVDWDVVGPAVMKMVEGGA